MTRVDFHFNAPDKIGYGCRLVRKIYRTGQKVVVWCDDPVRLSEFDRALWTFSALDFIPHVMASDASAPQTPVLLLADAARDTPHHDVLVNLGSDAPEVFSRFERLIEVVTPGDDDRLRARERWRFYRERGYPIETFDLAGAAS